MNMMVKKGRTMNMLNLAKADGSEMTIKKFLAAAMSRELKGTS